MKPQELHNFQKENQQKPVLLSWISEGGMPCSFIGKFSVDQLCILKEVINRRIDSLLDKAIIFDAIPTQPKLVEAQKES